MKMSYILLVVVAVLTMSLCDAITGDVLRSLKSDIASLSRAVHSRRPRNDVKQLTAKEQSEIVALHNNARALEESSNMELISYNETLVNEAEENVTDCSAIESKHVNIGQNRFYADAGKPINLTSAVQSWYYEKSYYIYDTGQCALGKYCVRYLQLVWMATTDVGCAYRDCVNNNNRKMRILVCNYWPKATITRGTKPYAKGDACSKCERGAGWCKNNLCDNRCASGNDSCPWETCAAVCYNCAMLNPTTCRCNCTGGGKGFDCTQPCVDDKTKCGPGKNFDDANKMCDSPEVYPGVIKACPAMCEDCKAADPNATCSPVYGPAAPGRFEPPSSAALRSFIKVQHVTLTSAMVLVTLTVSNGLKPALH